MVVGSANLLLFSNLRLIIMVECIDVLSIWAEGRSLDAAATTPDGSDGIAVGCTVIPVF